MRRRQVFASLLGVLLGAQTRLQIARPDAADTAPEKIRLIPDELRINHVGRLSDGRLYFVDSQFFFLGGNLTWDFASTLRFGSYGRAIKDVIEFVGERNAYPEGNMGVAITRHLDVLGERIVTDIWVRPFSLESSGTMFGLIPRRIARGDWRVEFMPGNTLSFYPPWESGGYDT